MVLGLDLAGGIEKIGHQRSTKTKELVAALGDLSLDTRLISVRQRAVPQLAIMKVTWIGFPWGSHFVVREGLWVYDPLMRDKIEKADWHRWLEGKGRVTSALELRSMAD